MTLSEVRTCLTDIKSAADDPEMAHGLEDELHQAVLTAIAEGKCDDPVACAKAALESLDINFPRWRA